jgi:mRNA-degrading endonuclease RelE of RelBE toxin-antitoxin system
MVTLSDSSGAVAAIAVAKVPTCWTNAVIDFLATALLDGLRRVGKPLRGDLAGLWSARRGTYRVLYRINQDRSEVILIRVDHRRDAYRA